MWCTGAAWRVARSRARCPTSISLFGAVLGGERGDEHRCRQGQSQLAEPVAPDRWNQHSSLGFASQPRVEGIRRREQEAPHFIVPPEQHVGYGHHFAPLVVPNGRQ